MTLQSDQRESQLRFDTIKKKIKKKQRVPLRVLVVVVVVSSSS